MKDTLKSLAKLSFYLNAAIVIVNLNCWSFKHFWFYNSLKITNWMLVSLKWFLHLCLLEKYPSWCFICHFIPKEVLIMSISVVPEAGGWSKTLLPLCLGIYYNFFSQIHPYTVLPRVIPQLYIKYTTNLLLYYSYCNVYPITMHYSGYYISLCHCNTMICDQISTRTPLC